MSSLAPILFASLKRSDQRHRAVQYVHALLSTPGRKSVRNIAHAVGGSAAAQRLHHFVCSSPWEWQPVRRTTAQRLARVAPPRAWVVRRFVFPKAGTSSVGVERSYEQAHGRMLNAQRGLDVWAASPELTYPVEWQLHLPAAWVADHGRRHAADIPDEARVQSFDDIVAATCGEIAHGWGLPRRPVVLDARCIDVPQLVSRLHRDRLPFLVRVDEYLPLTPVGTAGASATATASRHLQGHASMRRPVTPARRDSGDLPVFAATVPVRLAAHGPTSAPTPLTLVGLSTLGGPWPERLWLTDVDAPTTKLYELTRLLDQVEHEFESASATAGLRDFAGRSYGGWHRHLTLASVAHVVSALAAAGHDVTGTGMAP